MRISLHISVVEHYSPLHLPLIITFLALSSLGVVLSIIAGKRVSDIQEKFNTKLVIRTMPNTPASIMEGMTVWYPAEEVPPEVQNQARQLLELTGSALLVTTENTLDMVIMDEDEGCLGGERNQSF